MAPRDVPVAQAERYKLRDLLTPLGQLDLSVHAGPILNLLKLKTSTWLGPNPRNFLVGGGSPGGIRRDTYETRLVFC